MEKSFTIEEIEKAIRQSPKHNVFIKKSPSVDDDFDANIETIEVNMFLFRLLDSNKNVYDKYKESKL